MMPSIFTSGYKDAVKEADTATEQLRDINARLEAGEVFGGHKSVDRDTFKRHAPTLHAHAH